MNGNKENLSCRLFGHRWEGCRCSRCGDVRDEGHSWDGCRCSRCGRQRDEGHVWNGCRCSVCGRQRDEGHSWKGIRCHECRGKDPKQYCGSAYCRREAFDPEDADWGKTCLRVCTICGEQLLAEHSMRRVRGKCYEECSVCGSRTRPDHSWNGCRCTVCGEKRDEGHSWVVSGCETRCSVCGKKTEKHDFRLLRHDAVYGSGKCPKVNASDDYACNFCPTPEACLKYPKTDRYLYKCSRCGRMKSSAREL